jgi:hypothetical protein
MYQLSKNTLWGAWRSFAKNVRKPHKPYATLPKLSPRLARDIGLSDNEVERAAFEWPSDSPERPLI